MRVLFINTFDIRGGAAIAAERLRSGLMDIYKDDTRLLVPYKLSDDKNVIAVRSNLQEWCERVMNRIQNLSGFQYQFFPFSSNSILNKARDFKPDVISLHNTQGGYFATRLLPVLSQIAPVYWTLHDMWSFTGNSAHTFGNEAWKEMRHPYELTKISPSIGINNGVYLLRQKKRIYERTDLTLITPSKWLRDLAVQSPAFQKKQIIHINNGINLKVFRRYDRTEVRRKFGIPPDANTMMFSADSLQNNPWKGGADLVAAIHSIGKDATDPIHLIVSGRGELGEVGDNPKFVVHRTGFITNPVEMAEYMSASDIFLYPTRADNLPNVLIEAIACGIPCVTSDVGGCAEIIVDGYNGAVVRPARPDEMASAVIRLLRDRDKLSEMSANARKYAELNFSVEDMSSKYRELFKSKL